VNLELAAQLDMRMGGHIVQGHVDGTGEVQQILPGEKWLQFDITAP
jgi:riboflavin synthase